MPALQTQHRTQPGPDIVRVRPYSACGPYVFAAPFEHCTQDPGRRLTRAAVDPPQWQGYIKDYDGGTLMECLLDSRVPHVDIPQMVRAQRAALDSRIRGLSQSHIVYMGLQHFDEHGRRKHIDIMSIPGAGRAISL